MKVESVLYTGIVHVKRLMIYIYNIDINLYLITIYCLVSDSIIWVYIHSVYLVLVSDFPKSVTHVAIMVGDVIWHNMVFSVYIRIIYHDNNPTLCLVCIPCIKGQTNHAGRMPIHCHLLIHMYSWRNTWYCCWVNLNLCCTSFASEVLSSAVLSSAVNSTHLWSTTQYASSSTITTGAAAKYSSSSTVIPGTAASNAYHLPISTAHRYIK